MTEQKRTSLGVIFLTVFLDLVGFSILFPLFAHMMEYYSRADDGVLSAMMATAGSLIPDSSPAQRAALFGGILLGLYSILQFICAPLWGRLSDRFGRRRILLLTVFGNLLGYVLWIFADSFLLLLASRVVCGLCAGNISVATAAVADVTTPETRTRGMGFIGMAFGFGFILGPAIGGLSATDIGTAVPTGGLAWNPFSIPAVISAVLGAVNLFWIVSRFKETREFDALTANHSKTLNGQVTRVCLANLLFIIIFASMEATLVFLARERLSFSTAMMTSIFVTLGFTSAFVQGGLVRRLAPKMGPRKLAIIGLLLMIPSFLLVGATSWVPSTALLLCGIVVMGLGVGFTMPTLSSLVSLHADEAMQGAAMGRFRSMGALGRAIGPFLGAGLYFSLGPAAPYMAGAFCLLIPAVMVAAVPAPAGAGGDA